jgi:hypothetical protein
MAGNPDAAEPSTPGTAPEVPETGEPATRAALGAEVEPDAGSDADITPVNGQITDAVTQANLTVLGEAPAVSLALVYQSLAQATSLAFLNATQQQQQANMIAQAATAAAIARILAGDTTIGSPDAASAG